MHAISTIARERKQDSKKQHHTHNKQKKNKDIAAPNSLSELVVFPVVSFD